MVKVQPYQSSHKELYLLLSTRPHETNNEVFLSGSATITSLQTDKKKHINA